MGAATARRRHAAGWAILALALWLLLIATSDNFGPTWDEAYYVTYAMQLDDGLHALRRGAVTAAECASRYYHPDIHPAFTRLLALFSRVVLAQPRRLLHGGEILLDYRLGAMLLFAVSAVLLARYAAGRWGSSGGALALVLYAGLPSLFAHAHFAAMENALVALLTLATLAWLAALTRGGTGRWLLFAVAVGSLCSVKITGWLWLGPALLWLCCIYRRGRRATLTALSGGGLLFGALQVPLWLQGFAYFRHWIIEWNLNRAAHHRHWVYYLDTVHDYGAPWHYGPVMLAVTFTPVLLLALLLALLRWRHAPSRPEDTLFLWCLGLFAFATALPGAPAGDGNRYVLGAVPFAVLVALRGLLPLLAGLRPCARRTALGLLLLLALIPLLRAWPYPLAYYSELIGGASGARALGLESSYWWEVLNRDACSQITTLLPPNAVLAMLPADRSLPDLHARLRSFTPRIVLPGEPGPSPTHYLILSRPFWNFPRLFQYAGVSPAALVPRWAATLDGVPLLVLHERRANG